jgi:enoyl-CoA hydratase
MHMALLADRLNAVDAMQLGLVSAVHAVDELEGAAAEVIATLASGAAVALAKTKRAINAATLSQLESAFALEKSGQLQLLAAPDFAEGAAAFQERRPANFTDRLTS